MHTQYLDNLDGLNRQKQVQEAGTNPFILIMQAPVKRNFYCSKLVHGRRRRRKRKYKAEFQEENL